MISRAEYEAVHRVNVDEYVTACEARPWRDEFRNNPFVLSRVDAVVDAFHSSITRAGLIEFYRRREVPCETKFIAAMIWGHEAPAGSRRDSRGPWKLSKMFTDVSVAERAIKSVDVSTREHIVESYKALDGTLPRCGPNFFTKHFYFLGKAQGMRNYPLIFDDRVARGIAKLSAANPGAFDMVRVSAQRTPEAYLRYLDFAHGEASKIGCEPDQVEYYLFTLR